MSVGDEVRDPWTYVMGGIAGGLAWAALAGAAVAAAPAASGVGAAVAVTKILAGALTRPAGPKPRRVKPQRNLPILTRTHEAAWLARAENAQRAFDELARSAPEGPVSDRVREFGSETHESLASLARLAGQASAIRMALGRIDMRRLVWERDRLRASQERGGDPRVLAERQRSLGAVQSQIDAHQRLTVAITTLIARLESGTLGLEGLVARLAEVVALTETSVTAADGLQQVDELATELEGLRAGLVEAESVTTRAMEGLAPLPDEAPAVRPDAAPGTVPDAPNARRRATE
jgi:hypothetical protein